jgi:hypothetical protein
MKRAVREWFGREWSRRSRTEAGEGSKEGKKRA